MARKRKFWGWGFEGEGPDDEQIARLGQLVAHRFGVELPGRLSPPRAEDLELPAPRIAPPARLAALCSTATEDRAGHSYGKSFRDVVRGLRREFLNPPDLVVRPRDEDDVRAVLDWCDGARVVVVPYGGGSSVVGGVEPPPRGSAAAVVSLDLERLDRVLEVDRTSRAALIEGGVLGPSLEDQLRPHGLTLRHFPQSFEVSTLGGWIVTRSGGHFATLMTHIDDLVESIRTVTPTGTIESRRLPGSGAGPSPDRLILGSEGTLGVVTRAWMRLQDRPTMRASASVTFADFASAAGAVRAIAQSGTHPANCRLLDPGEALTSGAGDGSVAVLVLGFESADHELDPWMDRVLEICRDHAGTVPAAAGRTRRDAAEAHAGAAGAWRKSFLQAPYLRDALVTLGMISETFETATTWDAFPAFHAGLLEATTEAVHRVCGGGTVTARFTHVYPDGPAPYYTVMAPARPGSALEQWAEIKAAASEAILRLGGTITHHHAVGRDHRPWYDRQTPDGYSRALRAVKRELDPRGILNPGVLIDP